MKSLLIVIVMIVWVQETAPLDDAIARIADALRIEARAEDRARVSNRLVFDIEQAINVVSGQAGVDIDGDRLRQALGTSGHELSNSGDWRRCVFKRVHEATENCSVVANAMYLQIDSVEITDERASMVVTRHHTVGADAGESRIAVTQLRVIISYGTEWVIEEMVTLRRYNLDALAVGELRP